MARKYVIILTALCNQYIAANGGVRLAARKESLASKKALKSAKPPEGGAVPEPEPEKEEEVRI